MSQYNNSPLNRDILNEGVKSAVKIAFVFFLLLSTTSATSSGVSFDSLDEILGWMQTIGAAIVVLCVAVLGIQFMNSGELKEGFQKFIAIAVGGAILAGAGTIGDLFFDSSGAIF